MASYHFPPGSEGAARRFSKLAAYLSRNHSVVCIAPKHVDDAYCIADNQLAPFEVIRTWSPNLGSFRRWSDPSSSTRRFHWFPLFLKKWLQSLIFPDRAIFWSLMAFWQVRKLVKAERSVVLATTSPMFSTHLIGLLLRSPKTKWLADLRDFHYLQHKQFSFGFLRPLHRFLERKVMSDCDACTFVSQAMRDAYVREYPGILDKSSVIYHGVEVLNSEPDTKNNSKIRIGYAGTFYEGLRSPLALLNSLSELFRLNPGWKSKIEIVIIGPRVEHLIDDVDDEVLKCIHWLGPRSTEDARKELRECDWAWLVIPDLVNHKETLPVKLYEYLSLRIPILAFTSPDAEAAKMIKRFSAGLVFHPVGDNLPQSDLKRLGEGLFNYKTYSLQQDNYQTMLAELSLEKQNTEFETMFEHLVSSP